MGLCRDAEEGLLKLREAVDSGRAFRILVDTVAAQVAAQTWLGSAPVTTDKAPRDRLSSPLHPIDSQSLRWEK